MNKEDVIKSLKKLRNESNKRKFTQSIDMQVSLKDTDVKKQENKVDEYVILPHKLGKKFSIAALIDKELITEARKVFNEVVSKDDFSGLIKNPRLIRKLVRRHKYFVAQANIMTDVAKVFGRYLGPKGKMPNPKAGAIVPPNPSLLKGVYEKLQRTVHIMIKNQPTINVIIGTESMSDEQIADNVLAVYNTLLRKLPRGGQQINKACLKFTMSKSVII